MRLSEFCHEDRCCSNITGAAIEPTVAYSPETLLDLYHRPDTTSSFECATKELLTISNGATETELQTSADGAECQDDGTWSLDSDGSAFETARCRGMSMLVVTKVMVAMFITMVLSTFRVVLALVRLVHERVDPYRHCTSQCQWWV